MLRYYLYQVPGHIAQSLPIAALLASVVVMVVLNRTSEVTAMRAAGLGPLQLGAPLACGGLVLSFFSFFIGEWVVPVASQRVHYIQSVLIEGDDEPNGGDSTWVRVDNRFVHVDTVDPKTGKVEGVKIVELTDNFRAANLLYAAQGSYSSAKKTWDLDAVVKLSYQGAIVSSYSQSDRMMADLPISPFRMKAERRRPDEMSITELGALIQQGQKYGKDVIALRVAWHVKWAYPLAAFVISFLGLKFGFRFERTTETVRSVLMAMALGMSYWFVLSASRALGMAGTIHPFLAGWAANFVVGAFVSYQVWRLEEF